MRLEPTAKPDHVLRVNSRLITASTILHFTSDELERAISQEQLENPAFEVIERQICLFCGASLQGQTCISCGFSGFSAQVTQVAFDTHKTIPDESISEQQWNEYFHLNTYDNGQIEDDEELDPMVSIPTGQTLAEVLLEQLETLVAPEDKPIAEQLVGNIDERGYLEASVEEIAKQLAVQVERVTFVLSQLQSLDPPGIGARDLRECLLIQLRAISEPEQPNPLAYVIIDHYLDLLGQGQIREIGRQIKVSEQEVRDVVHYIRQTLHPYPAYLYQMIGNANTLSTIHIRPDIIIRKTDTGHEVELIEEQRFGFSIVSGYGTQPLSIDDEIKNEEVHRYIRQYSNQATFFIECIHQRWRTLKRIALSLADYQSDFLEKGIRFMRHLTRSEIAQLLHLDEGTVSRAIANKYALLPNGHLIPLSEFFDGSLRAKDILRELITSEKTDHRLSDEELARLLSVRGIPIARRTVTKYREEMRIPPSRER
jgi:RNA polymerase sigma-54 factor